MPVLLQPEFHVQIGYGNPFDQYYSCESVWLCTQDGVAVAYALVGWTAIGELTVLEIETRPGWRNRGLSRVLLKQVEEHYHSTVHTDGDFTRDGFVYLSKGMAHNMLYNFRDSSHLPATPADVSIFVDDWNEMR